MKQPISRSWFFIVVWNNVVKSSFLSIFTLKIIPIFYKFIKEPWKKYKLLWRFSKQILKKYKHLHHFKEQLRKSKNLYAYIRGNDAWSSQLWMFQCYLVSFFHGFIKQHVSRAWFFKAIWNNGIKSSCLYLITFKIITILYHSIKEPWKKITSCYVVFQNNF